jgi:hypothetical protein
MIYVGRMTDENGAFELPLAAGTYALVNQAGFTFNPVSRTVTVPLPQRIRIRCWVIFFRLPV